MEVEVLEVLLSIIRRQRILHHDLILSLFSMTPVIGQEVTDMRKKIYQKCLTHYYVCDILYEL